MLFQSKTEGTREEEGEKKVLNLFSFNRRNYIQTDLKLYESVGEKSKVLKTQFIITNC